MKRKFNLVIALVMTFVMTFQGVVFAENSNGSRQEKQKPGKKFIVRLKDDNGLAALNSKEFKHMKKLGKKNIYTIEADDTTIESLKKDKSFKFVEEDSEITKLGDEITWNIENIKANELHEKGYYGDGVNVAVFDTGIDLSNDEFNVVGGVSFIDGVDSYDDDNGHGTAVAGILCAQQNGEGLMGVAPKINLYSVKVLDSEGKGNYSNIIEGLQWAAENDIDIITMSLGGTQFSGILKEAIDDAYKNNILVIAAAGNQGTVNELNYPASYDEVICVGAVDNKNKIASFSNKGVGIDLVAPGVDIETLGLDGTAATVSGTSAAVPHVAGVAAQLLSIKKELTNTQMRALLYRSATELGSRKVYGWGIVNAEAALEKIDSNLTMPEYHAAPLKYKPVDAGGDGEVTAQAVIVSGDEQTIGIGDSATVVLRFDTYHPQVIVTVKNEYTGTVVRTSTIAVQGGVNTSYTCPSGVMNSEAMYTINFHATDTEPIWDTFFVIYVEPDGNDDPPPAADDHGDDFEEATRVNVGSSIAGEIEEEYDEDYFKFTPSSSGNYIIKTTGSSDTYGVLFDRYYDEISSDDDSGTDNNFEINEYLTGGRAYYVAVSCYSDNTGSYRLSIYKQGTAEPGDYDTIATAKPIQLNVDYTDYIDYEGDVDYFKFTATSSTTYVMGTTGDSDTVGYLYDINGNELASNDDDEDLNFRISYRVQANQTYIIGVHYFDDSDSGSYTLCVVAPTPTLAFTSTPTSSGITKDSATISWSTNLSSNSTVEYGTTTSLGQSKTDSALVTSHSITLTGLNQNTTYYYRVKSTNGTTVTSGTSSFMTLADPKPDLIITNISWSPATPKAGDSVTFSATVKNQGIAATPSNVIHGVRFFIDGTLVTWCASYTTSIAPGNSVTITANAGNSGATWKALDGTYEVAADIDMAGRIPESNETNNDDYSEQINISGRPDLVVTNISWTPSSPVEGDGVIFSATVKNQGSVATPAGVTNSVKFIIDTKEIWSTGYSTSIPAGSTVTFTANTSVASGVWTATNGAHDVYAVADAGGNIAESDEDNNDGYSERITVSGLPDLGIARVNIPSVGNISGGEQIQLSADISNTGLGNSPASGFEVLFQIKKASTSEVVHTFYGYVNKSMSSNPSGYYTENVKADQVWSAVPGDYKVVVKVDSGSDVNESNENNNTFERSVKVVGYDDNETGNDAIAGAVSLPVSGIFWKDRSSKIHDGQDEDWYYVDISKDNIDLCLQLQGPGYETSSTNTDDENYDIELLDANADVIAVSKSNYSSKSLEWIRHEVDSGRYYIRIFPRDSNQSSDTQKYTIFIRTQSADARYGGEFFGWDFSGPNKMADASQGLDIKIGNGMDTVWGTIGRKNITYKDLLEGFTYKTPENITVTKGSALNIWNNAPIQGAPDKIFTIDNSWWVDNVIRLATKDETDATAVCYASDNFEIAINAKNFNLSVLEKIIPGFFDDEIDYSDAILSHELGHAMGLKDLYVSRWDGYKDAQGRAIDNTDKIMFGWHNWWKLDKDSFISSKDIEGLSRVQGWDGLAYGLKMKKQAGAQAPNQAYASYVGITDEELYRNSYMIVRGKVTSITDGYDAEDGFYYSTVTMDVDNYYKNLSGNNNDQITFLQDGNSEMPFIENTLMEVGEEFILFLRKTESDNLIIMGGPQGRFDVWDAGEGLIVQNHLQKRIEQDINVQGYFNENSETKSLDTFEQEINDNIGKIAPTISVSTTPAPNEFKWFNSDVKVHFTAEDPLYGVASVTPDITLTTEGKGQSATGTAVNKAGNSATYTLSDINIDKTKPIITGKTLEQPNVKGWFNKDVTVHFDASDALSGIDSVTEDTLISTEVFNHSVTGTAADLAGNSDSYVVDNINIDKTVPVISVSLEGSDWRNQDAVVTPTVTDEGGSKIDSIAFSWSMDGNTPQSWENYNGGELKQGNDGVWYLNIRALDNAGNETTEKFGPYKVDKTLPQLEAVPSENSWTNTDIDIQPVFKDENGSGIKNAQYVLIREGEMPASWNDYTDGKVTVKDEGNWYIYLKAADNAGNENSLKFGPYKIDKTVPTVSVTPESRDWFNVDISVAPTFGDEGGSQIAARQYQWSKEEAVPAHWNEYSGDSITYNVDGVWYLHLRVADTAGNEIITKYGPYKIDKTAPTTKAVPDGRGWSNTDVSVTAEYNDIGGSELSSTQYAWSKDENAPTAWNDYNGLEITQTEEGSWYLYLKASDNAGNTTVDRYGQYQVDRTVPVISVSLESRNWRNKDIVVEPSFKDENGSGIGTAQYAWSGNETEPGQWNSYISGSIVQAEEGIWYLHLRAVDRAGNETTVKYGPYKTDKTAPRTSVSMGERDWDIADAEVAAEYTDEGGSELDKLQYAWSRNEEPTQWEDYTGRNIKQAEDGVWYLYLKAVDNAGNETVNRYGQYKVDKTAPEIKADPDKVGWVNRDIAVKPEITDIHSGVASMSYIWSESENASDEWLDYKGEELRVADTGVWYLHLRATDNVGNERTVTFGPYRIDKVIPTVSVDPDSMDWINDILTVIPEFNDEGGSQLSTTQYSWSENENEPDSWRDCGANGVSQGKDGIWYLFLKAVDNAANEITSVFGAYKVDRTKPEITYHYDDEYTYGDRITLEFGATDTLSGINETYVNFDGDRYENGDEVLLDNPGINEIEMVATDVAGNVEKVTKQIEIIVPAEINIDPDVVNLKNLDKGNGDITVYIKFPEGLSVSDIELETISMNDEIEPVTDDKYGYVKNPVSDYDGDGIDEFMVKFERTSLVGILKEGDNGISITGRAGDYRFTWSGNLEAKSPGKEK